MKSSQLISIIGAVAAVMGMCLLGFQNHKQSANLEILNKEIQYRDVVVRQLQEGIDERDIVIDSLSQDRDSLAAVLVKYSISYSRLSTVEKNEFQKKALDYLNQLEQ